MTLKPRPGGRYLDAEEVVRRVRAAGFAYLETSSEGARQQALEWMKQRPFVAAAGRSAADNDYRAQLERLEEAVLFVHFGDDLLSEGALVSMLLVPGQPLLIECSPQAPRDGMHALIARCAKVLGYEIVEQPDTRERVAPHPQHSAPRAAAVWEAGANFIAKFAGGWARSKSRA